MASGNRIVLVSSGRVSIEGTNFGHTEMGGWTYTGVVHRSLPGWNILLVSLLLGSGGGFLEVSLLPLIKRSRSVL